MRKEYRIENADFGYSYRNIDEIGITYAQADRSQVEAEKKTLAIVNNGGAVVWHDNGFLHIRTRKGTHKYRGSFVDGCDASDPFVRKLASDILDMEK